MPSLNLSSPGVPGLAAGLFPVASNQLPQVAAGGGGDFAAMMAPPGALQAASPTSFLDSAPVVPTGTALPPVRQDVAGPLEPLPPVPVEDVMIGALPDASGDPTASGQAAPAPELPTTEAAQSQVGECQVETWDFHGASLRALARGTLQPAKPQPIVAPSGETPDFVEPIDADQSQPVTADAQAKPDDKAATPDMPAQLPQPTQPPFAPIDWTRPPPAPAPDAATDDAALESPRTAPAVASLPGPAAASAKPGPDSISTLPSQPDSQGAQPQVQQQPQQAQPQHQAPAPQGFNLPPEMAREVAEIVRAAVSDRDDTASAADSADSASSLPPIQATPTTPLHRDFVVAHRPVIDTSRAEWMQSMIERIAEMPQADGKREAQIRLSPDALGTVDVRIEQRQDRMHITMNADTAQARQLLAEAAPRLHELAEARGLRLGQTGIGGGESHDRQRPQEQQEQNVPLRPRSAEAAGDTSSETTGDLIA